MRTLIITLVVLAGCATAKVGPETTDFVSKSYYFEGIVDERPVTGSLTFHNDRYQFKSDYGTCFGDLRMRTFVGRYESFSCSGFSVRFSNTDDGVEDKALATVAKKVTVGYKQVCARWVTDTKGNTVCAEWRAQPIETTVMREGYVSIRTESD